MPTPEASDLADQSFEVFLHARHQLEVFPEVATDPGGTGQSLPPRRGHQRQRRCAACWGWRTTSSLRCAPKTSASPNPMRDCFMKHCSAAVRRPRRRCISAIIQVMTLPARSRQGCGRSGSTRRARSGKQMRLPDAEIRSLTRIAGVVGAVELSLRPTSEPCRSGLAGDGGLQSTQVRMSPFASKPAPTGAVHDFIRHEKARSDGGLFQQAVADLR